MKIVLQRVSESSVKVDNEIVGKIEKGLTLLIGVDEADEKEDADWLVKKVLDVRVFSDDAGKMNHSVKEINGEIFKLDQKLSQLNTSVNKMMLRLLKWFIY